MMPEFKLQDLRNGILETSFQHTEAFLRRSGLLGVAAAVSAAGQFVIVWSVARVRGVDPLGVYGLATSLTYLAQRMLLSGLQPLVMRGVARSDKGVGHSTGTAFLGVTVLGMLLTALLIVLAKVLGYSRYVVLTITIASLALIPDAIRAVSEWTAIALGRVRYVAFITIGASILQTLVIGTVVFIRRPLVQVFGVITCVSVLITVVYLVLLIRWVRPRRLESNIPELTRWLRSLWPFLGIGTFGALSRRLDIPILTQFGGFGAAGIYTAALKMVRPLILLRPAVFQAFFPIFVRLFDTKPEQSLRMTRETARLLSVLLSTMALITVVLANPLITTVYGADFAPAARVLQIMVWGVPAFYAQTLAASVLFANNQEKAAVRIYGINLVAEIGLSLLLAPTWGSAGMAVVYVLVRILGMLQMWLVLRRHRIDLQFGRRVLGPMFLAAMTSWLFAIFTRAIPPIAQLAACVMAGVLYNLMAIVAGFVSKRDLGLLWQVLRHCPSRPISHSQVGSE